MSVVTIFSASFCHGDEIAEKAAGQLGYKLMGSELVEAAANEFSISRDKLQSALTGSSSFFDRITADRDRYTACLRAALARLAADDNIVYHGYAGLLLPRTISHILRVCLVADHDYRISMAVKSENISEKEAASRIKKDDNQMLGWTDYLFNMVPWDEHLHDIIIPQHSTSVEDTVNLILDNVRKDVVHTTDESRKALQDYIIAAKAGVLMAEKKHHVDVSAEDGRIVITLKKYVMRLEHYKDDLRKLASEIPGVDEIEFRIGTTFNMPKTYPPVDLKVPKKILLVDDEVEFVQTLSDRLVSRQMKPSVVYNGEEALSYVDQDEPEVMVLDLKMPGIDGIEVLRRTKQEHPDVEVIILTGHGSEKEKQRALELGAFAYLEKPVNIDILAETMKKAYAKVNRMKQSGRDKE